MVPIDGLACRRFVGPQYSHGPTGDGEPSILKPCGQRCRHDSTTRLSEIRDQSMMGVFADYDNHSCDHVGKNYYDGHIILWGDAGSDVHDGRACGASPGVHYLRGSHLNLYC